MRVGLMPLALPRMTGARRRAAALFIAVFVATLYLLPMHIRLVQPTTLSPTALDRAVPFLDWTIWIYYSYAVFLLLPFVACRDDRRAVRLLYTLMANSILAALIFLVWPTSGLAQSPTSGGLTGLLWSMLLAVDRPSNLFPSLHIANTCTCAVALGHERRWRLVALVWPLSIAVSTLTTKQHLFVDLVGGMALAVFSAWLVRTGVRVPAL